MRRAVQIVGLLSLLLVTGLANAQPLDERERALIGDPAGPPLSGEELDRVTEEVTGLMRCPTCQGLSVAASPAPSALAMKARAEALLADGYDAEQVLQYFESSYGEFIRLAPRPEGFNLVVWLLPGLGLLVGGLAIWWRLRRRSSRAGVGPATSEDDGLAAYREQVRREVGL